MNFRDQVVTIVHEEIAKCLEVLTLNPIMEQQIREMVLKLMLEALKPGSMTAGVPSVTKAKRGRKPKISAVPSAIDVEELIEAAKKEVAAAREAEEVEEEVEEAISPIQYLMGEGKETSPISFPKEAGVVSKSAAKKSSAEYQREYRAKKKAEAERAGAVVTGTPDATSTNAGEVVAQAVAAVLQPVSNSTSTVAPAPIVAPTLAPPSPPTSSIPANHQDNFAEIDGLGI